MKQLDLFEDKHPFFKKSGSLFDMLAKSVSEQMRQVFEPPIKEWDIICGCKTKHCLTYEPVIINRYSDNADFDTLRGYYQESYYCPNCNKEIRVVNTKIKEIRSDLREARNNE